MATVEQMIRAKAKKYVKELATIECVHYHHGQFTTKQRYITPELEKAYFNGYMDGLREARATAALSVQDSQEK